MIANYDKERKVFSISVEDVQDVAVNMLNRRLTDDEMHAAEKCIDSGLSFCIETVFKAAIETAVEN